MYRAIDTNLKRAVALKVLPASVAGDAERLARFPARGGSPRVADGQRFLMIKEGAGTDQTAAPSSLIVVQHWTEELKRLVPVK